MYSIAGCLLLNHIYMHAMHEFHLFSIKLPNHPEYIGEFGAGGKWMTELSNQFTTSLFILLYFFFPFGIFFIFFCIISSSFGSLTTKNQMWIRFFFSNLLLYHIIECHLAVVHCVQCTIKACSRKWKYLCIYLFYTENTVL